MSNKLPEWFKANHTVKILRKELDKLFDTVSIKSYNSDDVYFYLTKKANTIRISYRQFPGCCGIALFHGIQYESVSFHKVQKVMEIIADNGNYGSMVYSTASNYQSNLEQNLHEFDWRSVHNFINPKTNNEVRLWAKSVS